jgi:ATP-dependent helicase/nuclease subunit B
MALLEAAKSTSAMTPESPWLEWVKGLDPAGAARPAARPRPRPPVEARPWKLSITAIDELIRDPYATFAHRILWLVPLDGLGGEYGPSERGQMVHAVLHRFTERHPGPLLPDDATLRLLEDARAVIAEMGVDEATAALWWPQMERIARWFIERERQWRETARAQHVELDGRIEFPVGGKAFVLSGRADRIDELHDGTLRIMDYKTGALPSFTDHKQGYSPQLLIEAHMAMQGGFASVAAAPVGDLMYVRLSGGDPAGEVKLHPANVAAAAEQTAAGLKRLLDGYADPATPYEARDWSREPDGARDYGHLSRWREWAAESGGDGI